MMFSASFLGSWDIKSFSSGFIDTYRYFFVFRWLELEYLLAGISFRWSCVFSSCWVCLSAAQVS